MVEMVTYCGFNQFGRTLCSEFFLGLALELRIRQEYRQHDATATKNILGGNGGGLLLTDHFTIGFNCLGQRIAKTSFVRAAKRGRDGITIGMEIAFAGFRPANRPFHTPRTVRKLCLTRKWTFSDKVAPLEGHLKIIENAVGEFQDFLLRGWVVTGQQ